MRRWLTLVSIAALAACTAEADSTPAGDAADPAEASEAAANETPAEPEEPVVTAEGWGPLRVGMTREEVIEAMGPTSEPDAVSGLDPELCEEFHPVRAPEGLYVMIEDGVLVRITVFENGDIETDAGLSIGDSAGAVREAYGDRLHAVPHNYLDLPAEYLTVWAVGDPGSQPYTDDPAARGIRYETDLEQNVERIHAGSSSIQYIEGCL